MVQQELRTGDKIVFQGINLTVTKVDRATHGWWSAICQDSFKREYVVNMDDEWQPAIL